VAAVQQYLHKVISVVGPATSTELQGYTRVLQDTKAWLAQLGSLTVDAPAAEHTEKWPVQWQSTQFVWSIYVKMELLEGTGYITELWVHADNTNCSTERVHWAIDMQLLPTLLSALPKLREFRCTSCCGLPLRSSAAETKWLPPDLPQAASELTSLTLTNCGLLGTLPAAWGNWTSLQVLQLGGNSIRGTLPGSFAGMTNLRVLGVSSNPLTGTLPAAFGELQMMQRDIQLEITATFINSSILSSWSYFTSGAAYVNAYPSQVHGCLQGSMSVWWCLQDYTQINANETDCEGYDDVDMYNNSVHHHIHTLLPDYSSFKS
jgi:hypothetical protein